MLPQGRLRYRFCMSAFSFLADTYETERLKILSVWSQIPAGQMQFRPEPRARTPLEHMVHQCISEDGWMRNMLGIDVGPAVLPVDETRLAFINHYAAASAARLVVLKEKPDAWFQEPTQFFDTTRSRAWVLVRRLTHSAHHRGQLTAYIRAWGQPLFSTYGPTADTGGLPKNGATVVYCYNSVEDLLAHEGRDGERVLPGTGSAPPTERP
jgi:uncharacterized damage-inducible protein DinB